ncbi:MAG TPA: flagellar basal body L-ring protein FlgH [Terracidiphilus sp.]|nr:flagellar basal body L-ring protein FlgH [Terracidiphilus sp.]
MKTNFDRLIFFFACAGMLLCGAANATAKTRKPESPAQLRSQYIAHVQETDVPTVQRTTGSLWTPDAQLNDVSTDYKARRLNDTLVILVSVQTTAAQSGDVNSARAFQTNSAITGLAGDINTKGLNPLFNANSSSSLKGAGATDSSTTFQTSLTAQVVAVLPSGNLVVEAQRKIFMNNQHEDVTVRGVVRPNDIGPNNTVPSAALSNLEIEMKGKGIISDSTRSPNFITRALLWLTGF